MPTIHLIDGEKGGVGKSLVTRTMVQYCLDKRIPFVPVETDRSNPDVAGVYKGICQYAVFTEDERQADKADRIFEMAMSKPVIVNLAAQSHRAVKSWIEKNQLIELGSSEGVSFCKWFVSTGGYDSLNLFVQSVNSYGDRILHILVKNFGLCDDWEHVESDPVMQKLLKKHRIQVIDFPKLSYKERNIIDQNRLTFAEAREYKEFGVLGRQRVVHFLKLAYAAFETVGIWYEEVNRV
ncbi:mobilization protein [Nostoc sp. CENA67]|uniref:Mobilization protein n=1 Tax=Amazonocrinis nigriterrae CENA67 TaxID=2794033 RepID=A0A8J7L6P9_9NOST|nr:mobilization protein [Amazonocrinis nigriterrae]MBH8561310.1 mobilization protein [Amazonocrinis nigriterrae CENA67]